MLIKRSSMVGEMGQKDANIHVDEVVGIERALIDGQYLTIIRITEEARFRELMPYSHIMVKQTYFEMFLSFLTEQAEIINDVKPKNKFFKAVNADFKATVEWFKNAIKK